MILKKCYIILYNILDNNININDYSKYNYLYQNGFYNSSIGTYSKVEFSTEFATKFICTELFDRESLPVGSILVVDEGYQYRPDGWNGDSLTENRPSNIKTNIVVIDETWWGEFTVRGINISKVGGAVINQNPHEAASHFRIYIPN